MSLESNISINPADFDKICRTCFGEDNISSICEMIVEDIKAVELLKFSVNIEVDKNDLLPQNICLSCVKKIFKFYEFKKQCHENEALLEFILKNSRNECNDEKNDTLSDDAGDRDEFFCNTNITEESSEENGEESEGNKSGDNSQVDLLNQISQEGEDEDEDEESSQSLSLENINDKKKSSTYTCRQCKASFDKKEDLQEHRKQSRHLENKSYNCIICGKMFTSSKLRQHMRSHTKEKPYQCDICLQNFSMSGNLKRHMMTHTGERPHVCEVCGKGFIQSTSLQNHQKTHKEATCDFLTNETQKFVCNFCGRGFKRLAPFNLHLEKHTSDKKIIKKVPGSNTSCTSEIDEKKDHFCSICRKSYKTKHLLKAHQQTHGEKSFLCSFCGKGFVTKAALQSHLKVHTGEKPHTCVICKKSFAHVGSFDSHMLIHSGQKPYSCNFCPKSFTQLSHLTYHLRTHSGERPYACSYCGKSFALKGNLTVHVRTHTGETPYVCTVCGKGFYDSSSMKKHKKNHKGGNMVPACFQQTEVIHQNTFDIPIIESELNVVCELP